MNQTFEEWLKENRKRDENVIKGEKKVEELRQELRQKLINHFNETADETWCKCDLCTLIRITANENRLVDGLACVGLQYLLGENFNGTSALYYYAYAKEEIGL